MEIIIVFFRCWTKLVYSFNHCQFICCGIIQKFSRILSMNKAARPYCVLISWKLLFSVIQFDKTLIWTPDNIFVVSGTVSNYLITGFNTGYCPNLFIPQNNMFRLKGTGHTQTLLFDRLIYNLYNKEILCPLLSSAVENILMKSKTDLEMQFFPSNFKQLKGWLQPFLTIVNVLL